MALPEIEFELSSHQYEQMGYPGLRQGQPLWPVLDAGILLPDLAAESWFAVQKEPLPPRLVHIGPALYAFAGQIGQADLRKDDDEETGVLLVDTGLAPLRVTCAPAADGRLPFGTWETRYLTGVGRLQGIVEEEFTSSVGQSVGVTLWSFRRLILTPGDALFGQWHETVDLLPQPFGYDRIYVTARIHRQGM